MISQGEWDRWHNSICRGDNKCKQNFSQERWGENYTLLEYVMWFGGGYHHCRTICCLYIHSRHPADGSSIFLWNGHTHQLNNTESHPRRPWSLYTVITTERNKLLASPRILYTAKLVNHSAWKQNRWSCSGSTKIFLGHKTGIHIYA